jgi:hypothetical protein
VLATFQTLAARSGSRLHVSDVVPLPRHDRFGISSLFTVIAVLIPSLALGGLLTWTAAGQTLPRRLGVVLAYAILAGLLATLNVDLVIGALSRALPILVVGVALAASVAATTHGLGRLLGGPGVGLAVMVLLIVGLPSSGGAVGHDFQPAFYGAVSQWLPPGAALASLRNGVYFDWAGTLQPMLALAGWALLGAALLSLDAARLRARLTAARGAAAPPASSASATDSPSSTSSS